MNQVLQQAEVIQEISKNAYETGYETGYKAGYALAKEEILNDSKSPRYTSPPANI